MSCGNLELSDDCCLRGDCAIPSIPDFTDAERKVIEGALRERYGQPVPFELAEVELKLDPAAPVLTPCPAVYWSARGAHFVIAKVGDAPRHAFRPQFFYSPDQLYWTGRAEYESLLDCVLEILRAQADHERDSKGVDSGATGGDIEDESE